MASRGDESKRNRVRIFSFDSLKSSSSRSSLDKLEHDLSGRGSPKPSIAWRVPDNPDGGNGNAADQELTVKELVESPRLGEEPLSFLTSGVGPERRVGNLRKPAPEKLNRSDSGENLPSISQSGARWEHLRQYVIGVPARSGTPPIAPSQSFPTTSQHTLPPRSQSPKPSRLAKFGFRHVVDQARELGVDDTRKFAAELQNICWSIRSVEGHRKEPTGSSLYLPFMSNTSLSTMENSGADNFSHGNNNNFQFRRPQSMQSLAHAHYSVSSIGPLYQSLLQHATPVNGALPSPRLPMEAEVLSTLLTSFTTSARGVHVDDEMRLAVESFDLLTRTWPPSNEVSPLEVVDVASLIKTYRSQELNVVCGVVKLL